MVVDKTPVQRNGLAPICVSFSSPQYASYLLILGDFGGITRPRSVLMHISWLWAVSLAAAAGTKAGGYDAHPSSHSVVPSPSPPHHPPHPHPPLASWYPESQKQSNHPEPAKQTGHHKFLAVRDPQLPKLPVPPKPTPPGPPTVPNPPKPPPSGPPTLPDPPKPTPPAPPKLPLPDPPKRPDPPKLPEPPKDPSPPEHPEPPKQPEPPKEPSKKPEAPSARVVNQCDFPVYLWSVAWDTDGPYDIETGDAYVEKFVKGGVALEIVTEKSAPLHVILLTVANTKPFLCA